MPGFLGFLHAFFAPTKPETPDETFARERREAPAIPAHSPGMSGRKESLSLEIDAVEWAAFDTAYGNPGTVPLDLKLLMFGSEAQALKASCRLWSGLCHQHAYMSSAAEPALPFLLTALNESNERIQVEILDILAGFASLQDGRQPFTLRVFKALLNQRSRFEQLRYSANEEVADFTQNICDSLDSSSP